MVNAHHIKAKRANRFVLVMIMLKLIYKGEKEVHYEKLIYGSFTSKIYAYEGIEFAPKRRIYLGLNFCRKRYPNLSAPMVIFYTPISLLN